jgi:hypothetical protein
LNVFRFLSALLVASLLVPCAVGAQNLDRLRLTVAGGPTLNDLETGGLLWLGVASLEWRAASVPLLLDSSVRYSTFTAAEREHYPLVEVSAQWELRRGSISPFLGVGAGLAWRIRPAETNRRASTHVTAGLRAALGSRAAVRAEARFRSVEPLGDFTLGLSWRL